MFQPKLPLTRAPAIPEIQEREHLSRPREMEFPTLWGLDPVELHDRFWASKKIQVVRRGSSEQIRSEAEHYLLLSPEALTIFPLVGLEDHVKWLNPRLLYLRLHDKREEGYRERIQLCENRRFHGFERCYGTVKTRRALVAMTSDANVAELWRDETHDEDPWSSFSRRIPESESYSTSIPGRYHSSSSRQDVRGCVEDLLHTWENPELEISGVRRVNSDLLMHRDSEVDNSVRLIGKVWIGAGRKLEGGIQVVGPTILWDDPDARPQCGPPTWERATSHWARAVDLPAGGMAGDLPRRRLQGKRAFDVLFALGILAATLPLYPLIMLWIYLQDGRPFFFAHRRQTLGGRVFPCLKFRTMRKDAEKIKHRLMQENQVDGPQFYIENDPRLIRGARWLRKFKVDELPQFLNVLVGDMSVVGPRPSPTNENRFCPPWNEARLSVRAGVTGLWQVSRTREEGLDFQEWIRFDIEYVEKLSWRQELKILWRTIIITVKGK